MQADPAALAACLGLPGAHVEMEPISAHASRVTVVAGDAPRTAFVRSGGDAERSENHARVLEALGRAGFPFAPRLIAELPGETVEEWVDGVSALALVPSPASLEAAIDALAALHALSIREGLRWEQSPAGILGNDDPPLHRLGFAAHEREAASPALREAREVMRDTPWGFVHGDATAAHIRLTGDRATLVSFAAAGFGPQLFDVAAFLATAGLDAADRRGLASAYASRRQLDPPTIVDLVDLATILWGIGEQLTLPHRLIHALGDDPAMHALNTAAGRIERAMRDPIGAHHTGAHPVAVRVREALWPRKIDA